MLIIFAGLPGIGKTTIARALARQLGAVHLRIDSIEQAIRATRAAEPVDDAGYRVAHAVAEDNLRIGRTVIADSVNPLTLTRNAWLRVAARSGVQHVEVEVVCSDPQEHRRRVEARPPDIPGFALPTWTDVIARKYHPWDRDRTVIDTARASLERCLETITAALRSAQARC